MPEPQPRFEIPDAWAGKGQCPICGAPGLAVRHLPGAPDQMTCARCQASFEVEQNTSHIRLTGVPLPALSPLVGAWLTMAEVMQRAGSPSASTKNQPAHPPSLAIVSPPTPIEPALPPPLSPELIAKIQELRALGNSPRQIQGILEKSVSSPEELQSALAELDRLERAKKARESRTVWVVGSLAGLALVIMMGAAMIFSRGAANTANTARNGTPPASGAAATSAAPNIPPALQTLIPPGVTVVAAPTVFVQTAAPAASGGNTRPAACPTIAAGAATLFGGIASNWTYDSQNRGWTFISTSPTTLNVPQGMYVGYLEFGASINITQVSGPATVGNVVFAAVSCE
jgi:hypothetical protein